jgi:hypothetical protein
MSPPKTPASHVLCGQLGKADHAAGSTIKLSFDTLRKCARRDVLKPAPRLDLLVDPIAPRVENVGNAVKDIGDTGKERAEIASAVEEIRLFPHSAKHA